MSIPLQEPPGPAWRLKSPICLFLWGLWGGGETTEMHLTERRGPSLKAL